MVWEWYTKGMTSHRDCTHPKTKAARARCRKTKAEVAELLRQAEVEDKVYHDTYIRPYEEQEAARRLWEAESAKFAEVHIWSAENNADDTAHEEKFQPYSKRWYEVALSTLHSVRDDADRCWNIDDPEKGQSIYLDDDYRWVDGVIYPNSGTEVTLIDREGNHKTWMLDDLKAKLAEDEA